MSARRGLLGLILPALVLSMVSGRAAAPPLGDPADFTFSHWVNGWRRPAKAPSTSARDMLCFETGRYGFALDVADFSNARFALFSHKPATTDDPGRMTPATQDADSAPAPKTAGLQEAIELPLVFQGVKAGSIKLPAGRTLDIAGQTESHLIVVFSGEEYPVPKSKFAIGNNSPPPAAEAAPLAYAAGVGLRRFEELKPARLVLELSTGGNTAYKAVSSRSGRITSPTRLKHVLNRESGRFVQRFELKGVELQEPSGTAFDGTADLQIVAWPSTLLFLLELTPNQPISAGTVRLALEGDEATWSETQDTGSDWHAGETRTFLLRCQAGEATFQPEEAAVSVTSGGREFPAPFEEKWNAFVCDIQPRSLNRRWKTGYHDIRDYDEFEIAIKNNSGKRITVPILIDQRDYANITGICPVLCDVEGRPTGLPVQLSKNWHDRSPGTYARFFTLLPAGPGRSVHRLRVAYGFYGALPSASVAQLSLVGYRNGYGRWDQFAIGCWGETKCLDSDMSLRPHMVTDSRLLMVRKGLNGRRWGWSDGGWGGDWLGASGPDGSKLSVASLKAAYLSHGPCLAEIAYSGHYGEGRVVDVDAVVRTLRTDDYVRTFYDLDYAVRSPLVARSMDAKVPAWLFKMGSAPHYTTPRIAIGNRDGLLKEIDIDPGLPPGGLVMPPTELEGDGPWWIAFPGAHIEGDNDDDTTARTSAPGKKGKPQLPSGGKALLVRSFKGTFGTATVSRPTVVIRAALNKERGQPNAAAFLTTPPEIETLAAGDTVSMQLEWITLPREADDYYGPNEAFRQHLLEHTSSWKTVHREAIGNDLAVEVAGGELLRSYPVFIKAEPGAARVTAGITGGVGAVPLRIEGLDPSADYRLLRVVDGGTEEFDQSTHGHDFWQKNIDPATSTASLTYNLPLDGFPESTWILEKTERMQAAP